MTKLRSLFASWRRNQRGAFAVYAALAFPVLIALVGFGLDYWSTLSVKARLDAAADTSAIAGVRAATNYMQANGSKMSGAQLTNAAIAAGAAAALQAFNANAGPSQPLTGVTPKISLTYANLTFTGTTSYATTRPTGFAGLVGVNSIGIAGSATASQKQLTYINVYVLVDTSNSMGIAANQAAMTQLYNVSAPYNVDGLNVGCVFGCHVPLTGQVFDMESIAHKNNITLRIDVARAAIYNMAQTASSLAVSNNIAFAVYAMQANPNTGTLLSQVYPTLGTTSNYSALMTAMGPTSYVLDLGSNNGGGVGDSNQTTSLAQFASTMPAQGDGSSALTPLNYVYVVTDGELDTVGWACTFGHCTGAIPSSACDVIKSKGATVGVVYTTYVNIYTHNNAALGLDIRFADLVQPNVGLISGNLQGCSSGSSWYYQATDDTALLNAMSNLFASTLSVVRITN